MKNILSTVILFLFVAPILNAQEEEKNTKQLQEVEVTVDRLQRYYVDSSNVYLSRKDIEDLQPDDLGELLKKLPGVNVKSYGALGGLKTVSIRGLNGQHTATVIDGFLHTQAQTGQTNFGQIHLDNVESVIVQRGGSSELNIPANAQLSGNTIILASFEAQAPRIPLQQKLYTKFGSFGQVDHHYIVKTGSQKLFGGLQFKYRQSHGEYPFRYMNYQTEIKGIRKNNDYKDINGGANLHYHISKNHQINAFFHYFDANQGVPGAVVLYNDFANQRLSNQTLQFLTDYKGSVKWFNYRFYYKYSKDSLYYIDPSYLNTSGELKATYRNQSHDVGFNAYTSFFDKLFFTIGVEETYSKLRSVTSLTAQPERLHLSSFAKLNYKNDRWSAIAQIGFQHVKESNKTGINAPNTTRLTPYLELRYSLQKKVTFIAYYRNSFRMPNFNELYYNNIGTTSLKPEDAHQVNFTTSWTIKNTNKIYIGLQASAYYHRIHNMILSIPTKNLFVWSVQNIGKNQVTGADFLASFSWNISKRWNTQLTANYTLQESLDISNKNNPTYKHQVAYSPKHLVNGDVSIEYRNLGLRFSSFYSSSRYALTENISANLLKGFASFDLGIFNKFELGKYNTIRLQVTVKNITDASYSYVKSFVMPGRHYLFTFIYAFI